jgi:hypothetical protein
MADILLWSSFAVRSSDPALADAMLTAYATVVLAVFVPLFIWVRFFKPAVAAAQPVAPAEPAVPAPDAHLVWKPLRLTPMDHNADIRSPTSSSSTTCGVRLATTARRRRTPSS